MVAPFGNSLHVGPGRAGARGRRSHHIVRARRYRPGMRSERSLEDVFIELMGRAKDNLR